jgi:Uma2 family endonuclease
MAVEVAAARRLFTRAEYEAAAAGIPEYWVVDCVAESIEVHRVPGTDGYRDVTRVAGPVATVAPQAFPDVTLALTEVFA